MIENLRKKASFGLIKGVYVYYFYIKSSFFGHLSIKMIIKRYIVL